MSEQEDLVDDFTSNNAPALPSFPTATMGFQSEQVCSLTTWMIMFFLALRAKYYIPDAALDMLVKFLAIFFSVLGHFSPFQGWPNAAPSMLFAAHHAVYIGSL